MHQIPSVKFPLYSFPDIRYHFFFCCVGTICAIFQNQTISSFSSSSLIDSAIMDCVDEETGEIIDLEKLEALNIERDKKVEGIALAVKNYAAEAKAIKEEEEKLAKRRRS